MAILQVDTVTRTKSVAIDFGGLPISRKTSMSDEIPIIR
jgi:hypothetical protein